jgi:hypothetical protein
MILDDIVLPILRKGTPQDTSWEPSSFPWTRTLWPRKPWSCCLQAKSRARVGKLGSLAPKRSFIDVLLCKWIDMRDNMVVQFTPKKGKKVGHQQQT